MTDDRWRTRCEWSFIFSIRAILTKADDWWLKRTTDGLTDRCEWGIRCICHQVTHHRYWGHSRSALQTHQTLAQHCFNIGPTWPILNQHWANVSSSLANLCDWLHPVDEKMTKVGAKPKAVSTHFKVSRYRLLALQSSPHGFGAKSDATTCHLGD